MKRNLTILAAAAALAAGPAAWADLIIDLGGGWEATIFDEENVDLAVDFVDIERDILIIEKFARFIRIDPESGQPEPVRIAFNQVAPDSETVSRIAITDEFVFNHTGIDWTSYSNVLLGGNVAWDPDASADFSIDPFTETEYSDDNGVVTFSGGVIMDGDYWTPGIDSGALFIDVDLSSDEPVKFVLKETPLPAPGALAVLGLAGLLRARRRRA